MKPFRLLMGLVAVALVLILILVGAVTALLRLDMQHLAEGGSPAVVLSRSVEKNPAIVRYEGIGYWIHVHEPTGDYVIDPFFGPTARVDSETKELETLAWWDRLTREDIEAELVR